MNIASPASLLRKGKDQNEIPYKQLAHEHENGLDPEVKDEGLDADCPGGLGDSDDHKEDDEGCVEDADGMGDVLDFFRDQLEKELLITEEDRFELEGSDEASWTDEDGEGQEAGDGSPDKKDNESSDRGGLHPEDEGVDENDGAVDESERGDGANEVELANGMNECGLGPGIDGVVSDVTQSGSQCPKIEVYVGKEQDHPTLTIGLDGTVDSGAENLGDANFEGLAPCEGIHGVADCKMLDTNSGSGQSETPVSDSADEAESNPRDVSDGSVKPVVRIVIDSADDDVAVSVRVDSTGVKSTETERVERASNLDLDMDKVWMLTFPYLPFIPDRIRIERVCKQWQRLVKDEKCAGGTLEFDETVAGKFETFAERYHVRKIEGKEGIRKMIERSERCSLIVLDGGKIGELFGFLLGVLRKDIVIYEKFSRLALADDSIDLVLDVSKFLNLESFHDESGLYARKYGFNTDKLHTLRINGKMDRGESGSGDVGRQMTLVTSAKIRFLRVDFGEDSTVDDMKGLAQDFHFSRFLQKLELLTITIRNDHAAAMFTVLFDTFSKIPAPRKLVLFADNTTLLHTFTPGLEKIEKYVPPKNCDVYMFFDTGPGRFSNAKVMKLLEEPHVRLQAKLRVEQFRDNESNSKWCLVDASRFGFHVLFFKFIFLGSFDEVSISYRVRFSMVQCEESASFSHRCRFSMNPPPPPS